MNKRFSVVVLLALAGLAPVVQAAPFDVMECPAAFAKAAAAPYSLTVAEYDNVETCAATFKAAKINERRDRQEDRAIMRNFSNMKDGE